MPINKQKQQIDIYKINTNATIFVCIPQYSPLDKGVINHMDNIPPKDIVSLRWELNFDVF